MNSAGETTDQITRFLNRIPPGEGEFDSEDLQVVFESALSSSMTREQEDDMMGWLEQKFQGLKSELGYDDTASGGVDGMAWYARGGKDGKTAAASFMGRRQLQLMVYNSEVEWRKTLLGGIFEEHNVTIPAARRVVQQQIARANNYFFGSDPWMTVYPVGVEDIEFANSVDRWAKDRQTRNGSRQEHEAANEASFIIGEGVLKTTWVEERDYHETLASVLIGPDGEPFLASDGDFVFEDDAWLQGEGGWVLRRDNGATPAPEGLIGEDGSVNPNAFQVLKVQRVYTRKKQAETKLIYFKNFLCPLEATSVEDADVCVHLFDRDSIDVASDLIQASNGQTKMERLRELVNNMAANRGGSTTKGPRPEQGESYGITDTKATVHESDIDPQVALGEFWFHYDPFGDGLGRRSIVALVDLENFTPIHYDYVANVTPDAKRPFHVTRINPVANRWYGMGNMEVYWPLQEMIDLLANRWNQAQSASARVDFWNPSATLEGEADPHLKLNGGKTYTLKPGMRAEDALVSVFLTDIKSDRIHEQIQFFQQYMMNMSGVSNANDSRSAGLDTAQLATGIRNIHESGMELFSPWLGHLMPGHQSAIEAVILLEIEHMDKASVFHFFEKGVRRLGTVSRSELRYLSFDIRIELTRFRTEREIVQSAKARDEFHWFYSLPRALQALWKNQSVRVLTNLEVMDPESLIMADYFSFPEDMGIPTDAPTDTIQSGMGSQKPGAGM